MSLLKINQRDFLLYAPIGCTIDLLRLVLENISGFEKFITTSAISLISRKEISMEELSETSASSSSDRKLFIVLPSIFPEHWLFVNEWLENINTNKVSIHVISVVPEWIVRATSLLYSQHSLSKKENKPNRKIYSFTYLTSYASRNNLPEELKHDIDIVMFQSLILKECILYSKEAKTLHVSDSGFQISNEYAPTRINQALVKILGLYNRFSTVPFFQVGLSKDASNRLFNRVLTYSFDTIITAHTDGPLVGKGKERWIHGMKSWMI